MPSYFYHLKFELYPYSSSAAEARAKVKGKPGQKGEKGFEREGGSERESERQIWIPPKGSDIFGSGWPRHKSIWSGEDHSRAKRRLSGRDYESIKGRSAEGKIGREEATVIDCGVERDTVTATKERTEVPLPKLGELAAAERDWRFGRVRIEGVDIVGLGMDMEGKGDKEGRMGRGRGESSADGAGAGVGGGGKGVGINAGLEAVGRVAKARFEEVGRTKNTEVGWGIVHLYRDGEETTGLGREPVEVYTAGSAGEEEEKEDCTTLCIPAVPSYLTPSDFLGFVGETTREQVSHFRMVMTGRMNRYLVLMKFRDSKVAWDWRKEFDGKVFNSMEPETCHVVFIKSITFQTPNPSHPDTSYPELSHDPFTPASPASTFLKPFPPPTPNLVELPTCPVCLERMDDTTGLLTILCQHVFHCDCLQKWRGSGCPVCRHTNPSLTASQSNPNTYPYDSSNPPFGSGEASLCSVCDTTSDLWICLICGNVGCGRYKGGHAKEHWKESAHNFALEIETQHVWDYAGDLWVHRLIRGKGDSKIIELPSSRRSQGQGQGQGQDDMDMVPREKLESIGMEYTHLLTSQLESQRVYFEELVGKAAAKSSAASSAAASATAKAEEALSLLKTLKLENQQLKTEAIPALERDLDREKKKSEKSAELARNFSKSFMEEKKVSEGLLKRIEFVNERMKQVEEEIRVVRGENEELKESNRDLLFSISAESRLKEMEGEGVEGGTLERGEVEGGSLVVPEKERKGRGKKGKGRG